MIETNYISSLEPLTTFILEYYRKNPNYSYDKIIKDTLKLNKSKGWAKKFQKLNKIVLNESYCQLISDNKLPLDKNFRRFIVKKPGRGEHGIFSVSILSTPYPSWVDENGKKKTQQFSCKWNCYYCPQERENGKDVMPRSYLSREPACLRATRNNFEAIEQIYDRLYTLWKMGHDPDKIELIVLGGTALEYPREYLRYFSTECFYICNTFPKKNNRPMLSLEEEQKINETAKVRIIGYTLETRPDSINHESLYFMRTLGVTRVQIGVQHTSNRLLKIVNRGHTIEDSIDALKLLKDSGMKMICHAMPDLPYSTKEEDQEMFRQILENPELLSDEWKIYPYVTVPYTVTKKWHDQGKFQHNVDKDPNYLLDVIGDFMSKVPPQMRVPRIIRDIPNTYIEGGNKQGHLRQLVDNKVKTQEIRGREIRTSKLHNYPVLKIEKFESSEAQEYFIHYDTNHSQFDSKLLGFCRLRLKNKNKNNPFLPELNNSAIIRELHVYGQVTIVNNKNKEGVQHLGIGKKLVKQAEWIAFKNRYTHVCVTSGIGVRRYYQDKLGYNLEGLFMKKNILYQYFMYLFRIIVSLCFILYILYFIVQLKV